MASQTQLVDPESYDVNDMIFSKPVTTQVPDSKLTYKRVNISTKNKDGTQGELCIPTEELYSYGINTNVDAKGDIIGYTMPLCVYSKGGPTIKEKAFVDTFNKIIEKVKDHIMEHKDDLELYSLEERSELKKICNALYYKRDPKNKSKIMEDVSPTLYAKIIQNKKKNEIASTFFDLDNGNLVKPLDLLEKHCHARAVIKFESIFIGTKISLQVKLYECGIKLIDFGRKALLPRPSNSSSSLKVENSNSAPLASFDDDDDDIMVPSTTVNDDDDAGSLDIDVNNDEDANPPPPVIKEDAPKKKKIIKTVKK
jgi:hypothetical protein